MSKGCECAADELGLLSEAAYNAAYAGTCEPFRLYCIDDEPGIPPYGSFRFMGEATHAYQDPSAAPVDLAAGTGDFVTEAAGTNVTFTYTNDGCWPIQPMIFGEMVVNWNQTAGCSMQWNMKVHEDGVFLVQASIGQITGNNTDPGENEAFSLFYPGTILNPGESVTYQVRPEVSVTSPTAADEVIAVSAAIRVFGGDVTT